MTEKRQTVNEKEKEILNFWNENKIFEKSLEQTKDKKAFVFSDGPPFATGMPHYGHLLGSVIKDIYGRFWTMNERYVRRVWGWDCHGLPVEHIAEKGLGINSKDEIEKMGVDKFNKYCRSKVLGYTDDWKNVINRLGRWVDMENSYKTMDNEYIESVWWAFKQLFEKGYIYEGEKILMYCPRCSTPLAKAEVAMDNSYKNIKENTIVVKFKLKDEEAYALAWTTTPWTLPSNLALTVNPKLKYVYLKDTSDGTIYILGKDLISNFFKEEKEYEILKEITGKELEGKKYEPLFDYFSETKNAFKFLCGDFVTAEDGTGIVHTAPAFGEEDYAICKKYDIPLVQPVDEKGNFTEEIKDFAGQYIHKTNDKIIEFLKEQNKVVMIKKVKHEYPFCYRCDTKLIYRALPAWFVNIQKIKKRLLELNQKLNWHPEFLKNGRVKYTIETAPDWNISRNRYWATAIPIWKSKDNELLVIGSEEELKKYAKNLPKEKIDLHKDYLDKIILEKDGKEFKRIPEVLDCWFESGAMPFAQFHYPFENKKFFEENFPAQYVAEYIGQVRAWFYYMNVISAILFDDIPFENVVTTGTILAKDGQKMSKSKNNFTDPTILMEKFGVDALRFYLAGSTVMNADNIKFMDSQVEEIYKKVIMLLYNVNNFYKLYPNIKEGTLNSENPLDKWILSKTNKLIKTVTKNLKEYNTIQSCNEIRIFVDDLSNWFVRRSRERFNSGEKNVKEILKYVLKNLSKIMSPLIPFISERIYKDITNEESVHLSKWPLTNENLINEELENQMDYVREIVSKGLRMRDQERIGLKWPLAKITVSSNIKLSEELKLIILEELNIKKYQEKQSKDTTLEINLDFNLTEELKSEGFTREISRVIQAKRKKIGLVKENKINLIIESEFDEMIKKNIEFLIKRTGANEINFETIKEDSEEILSGNIKNKKFKLRIINHL